jgi:DNA polymerase-3 subunit gamma/tau
MAYTVFALKWRPQDFESIVGQDHIVGTLKNAIQKNRLANAYLFTGPRGVGKTSTARILAKALNCKEGPTIKPCQKCSSCLGINQGNSFDVIEIDGASNRGIDEIRALRENVKFSPTQGKYKVYIIDEVHQITPDGFNALLKTLEEPPEFVKFIFATTHPQKVMPTIISRCQRMDFRRIPVIEIISQLEKIVCEEKVAVDKEVLFAVAKSSDGSLRDAESVLDQLVSFSQGNISLKDAISVLGMVEQDVLFSLTDKIIQKDPQGALRLFNEIIDDGKDPGVFLTNLIEHFRNLMVAKVSKADTKLVDLPQEVCDRLFKQSQSLSLEEIFTAFNILVTTQEMAKRLDSQRIPLEISLVRLAYSKAVSSVPLGEKLKIPVPKNKEQAVLEETVKDDVPVQVLRESISLDQVKSVWSNIVNNLASIKMSVSTYLSEGEPTKVQGNMLTVAFPKNYSLHKESLDKKENKALIEKTASELCNTELRINFILVAQAKHEQDAHSNPFIKSALDMFGGRVVREG